MEGWKDSLAYLGRTVGYEAAQGFSHDEEEVDGGGGGALAFQRLVGGDLLRRGGAFSGVGRGWGSQGGGLGESV